MNEWIKIQMTKYLIMSQSLRYVNYNRSLSLLLNIDLMFLQISADYLLIKFSLLDKTINKSTVMS